MPDKAAEKPAGRPPRSEPSCLAGVASLVAAAALIVGIYVARPASVDVFARIKAWEALGTMVPVSAEDAQGGMLGTSVFVVDSGAKGAAPPLLFVHGFPTSSFDWKDVWPALCHEAERRCIAFDMLGYGLSEKPAGASYSVAMHGSVLRQVLSATIGDVARVDVLAHDLGDTVMQELLAATPGCTASGGAGTCPFRTVAMLNGGILPGEHRPRLAQTVLAHPVAGPLLQHVMIRPVFGVALSAVFGPKTQPSRIELDEDFALVAHNGGLGRTHSHLQYMAERSANRDRYVSALTDATPPLLLINGPADPVSGRHVVAAIGTSVGNIDVSVMPDHVGHFPQREMPRIVARRLEAWLKRVAK